MAERDVTDPFRTGAIANDPFAAINRARQADASLRREQGQLLLAGLEKLHIVPEILAWIDTEDDSILVLVTSLADRIESLSLYELLFEAQDKGIIDERVPLMSASVFSPSSELGVDLDRVLQVISKTGDVTFGGVPPTRVEKTHFALGVLDPAYAQGSEVIAFRKTKYTAIQDLGRWQRAKGILAQAA